MLEAWILVVFMNGELHPSPTPMSRPDCMDHLLVETAPAVCVNRDDPSRVIHNTTPPGRGRAGARNA